MTTTLPAASFRTRSTRARLTSAALSLALSLGLVSALTQGMHIDRLGIGAPVLRLESVTVTAQVPGTSLALAPAATRSN